ncbi:hypothetical protein [Salinibacterium sp. M195]|uniref:hypothetical protein n=1 Tax=Salinibacterium sp. M195 TaxID=2583374 RepID=UPI002101E972|nr:hypothetical protein [Salinibacterium sp. M195]
MYQSPTDGLAFIPFIGAVATFAIAVVAVLYWLAGPGRKFRFRAAALTVVAGVIGTASVLGLIASAESFEERDTIAYTAYTTDVQEWALAEYGISLTADDVADLRQGRPAIVERDGVSVPVLFQVEPLSGDVRLLKAQVLVDE